MLTWIFMGFCLAAGWAIFKWVQPKLGQGLDKLVEMAEEAKERRDGGG